MRNTPSAVPTWLADFNERSRLVYRTVVDYEDVMRKLGIVTSAALVLLEAALTVTSCRTGREPGSTGGKGDLGGFAGSNMAGGSTGGAPTKGPEFCGVRLHSNCEDGTVDVMFGLICTRTTVECTAGCRDDIASRAASVSPKALLTRQELESLLCNSPGMGGGGGSGGAD